MRKAQPLIPHMPPPRGPVRRAAQLQTAAHARDADDLADLLAVLGLGADRQVAGSNPATGAEGGGMETLEIGGR